MSYDDDDGGWPAYVSVAERRKKAERAAARLRKKGRAMAPIVIEGRKLATTFWGQAWNDNLEAYSDYASRLPRGRSYARNGSVIDLQVRGGQVEALVMGSELYEVKVTVAPLPKARWQSICNDCSGSIDSLVELLQGRLSQPVMARVSQQNTGLFPAPADLKMSCSCPDWASMCKHVAAVLYGIGARLDAQPALMFRLRGVDEAELIAGAAVGKTLATKAPASAKILDGGDLAALFGLEIEGSKPDAGAKSAPATKKPAAKAPVAVRAPAAKKAKVKPVAVSAPVKKKAVAPNAKAGTQRKKIRPKS